MFVKKSIYGFNWRCFEFEWGKPFDVIDNSSGLLRVTTNWVNELFQIVFLGIVFYFKKYNLL